MYIFFSLEKITKVLLFIVNKEIFTVIQFITLPINSFSSIMGEESEGEQRGNH